MTLRICAILISILAATIASAQTSHPGFDRNDYPGDDLLPALHTTFEYTGYWLNNPPGAGSNSWQGKRSILIKNGFGFLLLFNGRLDADLGKNAAMLGRSDAATAVAAAQKEGFPTQAIIFLDIEEGGRLLPGQLVYLLAWTDALRHSVYQPGAYCSGIAVSDGPGHTITTAQDIRAHDPAVALFVYNDLCPPSPGCRISPNPLAVSNSGTADALAWQYAQSPRRAAFTSRCGKTYSADNNCYAPGASRSSKTFIDLNVSTSADPSAGR